MRPNAKRDHDSDEEEPDEAVKQGRSFTSLMLSFYMTGNPVQV